MFLLYFSSFVAELLCLLLHNDLQSARNSFKIEDLLLLVNDFLLHELVLVS